MSSRDDMAARSEQLAGDLADELDKPKSDEREACEARKESEDREALERFYARTGQINPDPVQQAIAELVHRMEQAPTGAIRFADIEAPLTIAGRRGVLRFAPSPSKPGRRFIELAVWSESGLSNFSQWLESGSGDEYSFHGRGAHPISRPSPDGLTGGSASLNVLSTFIGWKDTRVVRERRHVRRNVF